MRNGRELARQYEHRDDEAKPSPTMSADWSLQCLSHKHECCVSQDG